MFLRLLQFSPVSVFPPKLHINSFPHSFIHSFIHPSIHPFTLSLTLFLWHNRPTQRTATLSSGSSITRNSTPQSVGLLWTRFRPVVDYLTPHNTHKRQTNMPPAGFEPAIPAIDRPQTLVFERSATYFFDTHFIVTLTSMPRFYKWSVSCMISDCIRISLTSCVLHTPSISSSFNLSS